jgi:hypothetical protein
MSPSKFPLWVHYQSVERQVRIMRRLIRIATIATMSFFKILITAKALESFMRFTLSVMVTALTASTCLTISKNTILRFSLEYYRMSFISMLKWKWALEYPVHLKRHSKLITCATMTKKMTMTQYRDLSLASIELVVLFLDKVPWMLATYIKREGGKLENKNKKLLKRLLVTLSKRFILW